MINILIKYISIFIIMMKICMINILIKHLD